MTSLFRLRTEASARPENGFSLILSVLDERQTRHEFNSRLTPMTRDHFLNSSRDAHRFNLNRRLLSLYRREVEAHGPPRPIRIAEEPSHFRSHPISIRWEDFQFRQGRHSVSLGFREPDSGRSVRLNLQPAPFFYVDQSKALRAGEVSLLTCPSMPLRGRVDGEEVEGEAWLDHQWGEMSAWFLSQEKRGRALGWDWFGINLDDGSVWLVMIHRDMKSGRPLARYAVVSLDKKKPRLFTEFSAVPTRRWESPHTHIRYPLVWQLQIPEIKAQLEFKPLADDQEIPIFGIMRAVWEGAGTVSGLIGGRAVQGRARLELNGYGYVFDLRKNLSEFGERVERSIESFLPRTIDQPQLEKYVGPPRWRHEPEASTETLSKPVWDLLDRRGKRWRPIFSLLLLEALGVPSAPYERLLSVIPELSHTGALIIDDIEDKSKRRRGDTCIHLRYGTDVAINAGNTLYFLPYLLLAQQPPLSERQRLRMYELMVQQFVSSHFGQGLDIYWSRRLNRRNLSRWADDSMAGKILQMYAFKTAAPLEAMASACCIISRADRRTRAACLAFAKSFGVAFQIIDDIHNFNDSPGWTKTCGEDIASGKLTYVIWQALHRSPPAGRDRLQRILCSPALRRDPGGLKEGIGLVRESGALPACRREAKLMVEKEGESLSLFLASSEPKIMLRLLCDHLLELSFQTRSAWIRK